jgi:hypothetical protein
MRFWLRVLYTGLRQGEQWNLELEDVHLDNDKPRVTVRYGSKGKTTKSGKTRVVYLIPEAVTVLEAWFKLLPTYCTSNDPKVVFPTQRGCRRQKGKMPKAWSLFLKSGVLDRNVRWHDLRHTCGSSLVAGWWGKAWKLELIRDLLGHSTVLVTEKYAHLAASTLSEAAAATRHRVPLPDEPRASANGAAPPAISSPRLAHAEEAAHPQLVVLIQRAPRGSNPQPSDSKSLELGNTNNRLAVSGSTELPVSTSNARGGNHVGANASRIGQRRRPSFDLRRSERPSARVSPKWLRVDRVGGAL